MIEIISIFWEWLSQYLTMENLTLLLATIGAIGTAADVIKSRRKLKFKLNYFGYNEEQHLVGAYIQIDNYSRLPIAITDFHMTVNGITYPCKKLPTRVATLDRKVGSTVVASQDFYNIPFPVQISPLGGASGYFLFELPPEVEILPAMPRSFQVSANRGHALKISLSPDREYFG